MHKYLMEISFFIANNIYKLPYTFCKNVYVYTKMYMYIQKC